MYNPVKNTASHTVGPFIRDRQRQESQQRQGPTVLPTPTVPEPTKPVPKF